MKTVVTFVVTFYTVREVEYMVGRKVHSLRTLTLPAGVEDDPITSSCYHTATATTKYKYSNTYLWNTHAGITHRVCDNTVEPPNNGHIGDKHFVHCSEVVPSSEVEMYGQ